MTGLGLQSMTQAYERWALQLASAPLYAGAERLVRRLVYLWCLLSMGAMLPAADQIWGPGAYALPIAQAREYRLLFDLDLLSRPALAPFYRWFITAYLLALVLGLLGKAPRLLSLLIMGLHHVLQLKAHALADGGDNLMSQFLVYLAVCAWAAPHPTAGAHVVRNLGFLCLRIQLCVMYATAGLTKWSGTLWPEGQALYYVLSTDEYTLPFVKDWASHWPTVLALATYVTVFFQIAFPCLIWKDPARRPMMVLGALIHLQIALVMGLMTFGLAMVISYTVFYTEREALAQLGAWDRGLSQMKAWVRALTRTTRSTPSP
ncbi:HTTM domain-containing protein [Stigmatella sp. ncwal1]|uniref:HTTM domain-containing protein n=1 Tax=Stigmatella ashevillensis TaxID=2995309 RepID=A0ABT5DFD9_9BACT|nr:HTTM domain-containing protein [Stigmatella ashevillena]MDC0711061.1 HTTM domain-containing protein [Stigmatella ashevillena]